MILHTFIDIEFPLLKSTDSVGQAIDIIENSGHTELPVVKNGKPMGILTLDQAFNCLNDSMLLDELLDSEHKIVTLKENCHPFHAIHHLNMHHRKLLPVVDEKGDYIGSLTMENLLPFLSSNQYIAADYGVIVLEVGNRNYSLSEISKIVEINNAVIIQSIITQDENSDLLDIHLKINRSDLKEILLTFERYEYTIKSVYHQSEYEIDMREKVNAFLDYLKI